MSREHNITEKAYKSISDCDICRNISKKISEAIMGEDCHENIPVTGGWENEYQ
ncbi:MAG: hypothetical protein ABRQ39_14345 [Candidatus Eremiobacterota bacterium]